MDDIDKQKTLASEILRLPEKDNVRKVSQIKSLSSKKSPSLAVLFKEHDCLPIEIKARISDQAKKNDFAKDVIQAVTTYAIIKTYGISWPSYRNQVLKFSFIISIYMGVDRFDKFRKEHWEEVAIALIDERGFWRESTSTVFKNAARIFIKAFNATHKEHIRFRAFSKANTTNNTKRNDCRASRQSALEYLATKNDGFQEWISLFEEWKNSIIMKNSKALNASIAHFIRFLDDNLLQLGATSFLMLKEKPCFWNYLLSHHNERERKTIRYHAVKIYEFTEWLINDKFCKNELGDRQVLFGSLFPPHIYNRIINFTVSGYKGKAENVKAILPLKYLNLIRDILLENNNAWPKSLNWTYTNTLNHSTGEYESVWNPHLTYLFLFMLEVPVRKIQVLSLDSGEGDDTQWIDGKWVVNHSKNAFYWSKNYGDRQGRGVIRKANGANSESTAIYINTNKTQDIASGFGATSGYTINWHNETIINIVNAMREWQEKYNPVEYPTAYRDIPTNIFSDSPTEATLNLIPDRFYLFRSPLNYKQNANYSAAPPADYFTFRFWHQLMNELELRLRAMGEDVTITTGWNANFPSRSVFTPHGLRGSGITALAEAGVPIEILSKIIAGHSSILMTLGYIKYNNAYISKVLDEARLKIEQEEQDNYATYLKNSTWNDAYKYAVFNESSGGAEWEQTQAAHLFENRQIGICPNSGTRCQEGGEQLRKSGQSKGVYGPVPGGNGNCVRCRFFMTGLPFLIPLWLKANKDLSDAQQISFEVNDLSSKLDDLRSKRFSTAKENGAQHIPPRLQTEIKQTEALLDAKSAKLNEILSNAHATYNLCERVKGLASDFPSSLPALTGGQQQNSESIEFCEVSLFRQRDFIVQASRLYPHIRDDKLELERNHFIDQIMFDMGMTPITLSALTESEKSAACDAAAKFLNSKLTDYELSMLESKKLSITNMGINKVEMQRITVEAKNDFVAISRQD